jgi:hypothetical protein
LFCEMAFTVEVVVATVETVEAAVFLVTTYV